MTNNDDSVQRFLFEKHAIRGVIVRLNKSFSTIISQYDYPTPVKQLLGESLLAAVMLSDMVKYKGQITLQLQSSGPITLLVAKCDHRFHIRGLAKWNEKIDFNFVETFLGDGELVITHQRDDIVKPYQSIVPLRGRNIPQALMHYFDQSEQLPSKFFMIISEHQAVGLMLQMMPEHQLQFDEDQWENIIKQLDVFNISEVWSKDNKNVLKFYFREYDIRLFDMNPVAFYCQCDLIRMQNAVKTLGKQQALKMLEKRSAIVVTCEYCRNEHAFNRHEIEEIFGD